MWTYTKLKVKESTNEKDKNQKAEKKAERKNLFLSPFFLVCICSILEVMRNNMVDLKEVS